MLIRAATASLTEPSSSGFFGTIGPRSGGGVVVVEVLIEIRSVVLVGPLGRLPALIEEDGGIGDGLSDGQQMRSLASASDVCPP